MSKSNAVWSVVGMWTNLSTNRFSKRVQCLSADALADCRRVT
jgi:hypothetical protein